MLLTNRSSLTVALQFAVMRRHQCICMLRSCQWRGCARMLNRCGVMFGLCLLASSCVRLCSQANPAMSWEGVVAICVPCTTPILFGSSPILHSDRVRWFCMRFLTQCCGYGGKCGKQNCAAVFSSHIEHLFFLVVKAVRQAKMRDAFWFSFFVVVLASASGKQQPLEPLTKFRAYCFAFWHRGQACG